MNERGKQTVHGGRRDEGGIVATPAWRLYGTTGSVPGVLVLSGGRLVLAVEDGRGFEAALHEVEKVVFPWYYFGGGVKVTVRGEEYRISFAEPNGQRDPDLRPGGLLGGVGPEALKIARDARRNAGLLNLRWGKTWRAALEGTGR